jgi:hypothetical protein
VAIIRPEKVPEKVTKKAFCSQCKKETDHEVLPYRGELIATCQNASVPDVTFEETGIRVGRELVPLKPEELKALLEMKDEEIAAKLSEAVPGWDKPRPCGHFLKFPLKGDVDALLAAHNKANAVIA